MDGSRYLILCAFVCAVLAASGCSTTGSSASAAPASATPYPAVTLAPLALTPADAPQGSTLTGSREKDAAEVSRLALDLGWQAGYVVTFTNNSAGPDGQTTIVQTLTAYPEKSIPGVIGVVIRQEQSGTDMTFSDIPAPGLGDTSGGFTGKAHPRSIVTMNDNSNPLIPVAAKTEPKQDFAEVYFSKGPIFEVIRMTGPGSDAVTVTTLARMAYAKIP
jgi:hypothetical protein